ncbi:DEAD/DEAH box helicase [Cohnella lupini]|uniref:Late competence protein required for DNA uptake (Superfamily II DNA/RNA helicase) n=1 Tax=Cohnella lupini TaxID=1294267 RepID=A0A3D9I746_9BACL|nr:helicase-related protein [Cohnella lupini]RED57614.1 late competence protein required for DNA uptake (superfamily II DNA/RNA helicase) [Cohnella lupini]
MKVVLYAVNEGTSYRALFTIAWEADQFYWSNREVHMIRIREIIPLGVAERVCRVLEKRWSGEDLGVKGDTPRRDWADDFRSIVHEVWAAEVRENGLTFEMVKEVGRSLKVQALDRLPQLARMVASLLEGRSLLLEEAVQLLDGLLPAEYPAAMHRAALQLAALTGAMQLTAAVAPNPVAPPLRGLRAWAERLRAACLPGLAASRRGPEVLACRRCGGKDKLRRTHCAACGQACAYCEACLTMGRSRECGLLIVGVPKSSGTPDQQSLPVPLSPFPTLTNLRPTSLADRWGLSPAQSEAAEAALSFILSPHDNTVHTRSRSFLLWAVTGAGKTEMIFPLLEAVLTRGGRALVATPRKDVVLELAPRLAKAFPDYGSSVLYGGSSDRWENRPLTLATTHQLLRFQEAFDLVIIDELDAFPFHNDPMLHYAAEKCQKTSGTTILLSATPPKKMQQAVAKGKLPCARVPARFHRHPLPEPRRLELPLISGLLRKQVLPAKFSISLKHSIGRGAQIFLFVPYVRQVDPFVNLLRDKAADLGISPEIIAGTSSKDGDRSDKVVSFRQKNTQVLVTTTILERGVTIPKSDVYILDANNPLFDEASLVQMAGRAGRSGADPAGFVFYGAPTWTNAQRNSIRQIRRMNSIARRKGYLHANA